MLSLKKLESVPINDPYSLRAVSFYCSKLEEVGFVEENDSKSSSDESPEKLNDSEIIMKAWPKVIWIFINLFVNNKNLNLFVIYRR